MKYRFFKFCIVTLLIVIGARVEAAELVKQFSGYGTTETADFEVNAPWIIDWVVNGDYPQMLAIEVSLIDARTGVHSGYVLKTKQAGDGVRLFDQGGRYRLRIDSAMTRWNFKIEQLTREEAALYTPVEKENM